MNVDNSWYLDKAEKLQKLSEEIKSEVKKSIPYEQWLRMNETKGHKWLHDRTRDPESERFTSGEFSKMYNDQMRLQANQKALNASFRNSQMLADTNRRNQLQPPDKHFNVPHFIKQYPTTFEECFPKTGSHKLHGYDKACNIPTNDTISDHRNLTNFYFWNKFYNIKP